MFIAVDKSKEDKIRPLQTTDSPIVQRFRSARIDRDPLLQQPPARIRDIIRLVYQNGRPRLWPDCGLGFGTTYSQSGIMGSPSEATPAPQHRI
jgi:hypothetical protein